MPSAAEHLPYNLDWHGYVHRARPLFKGRFLYVPNATSRRGDDVVYSQVPARAEAQQRGPAPNCSWLFVVLTLRVRLLHTEREGHGAMTAQNYPRIHTKRMPRTAILPAPS